MYDEPALKDLLLRAGFVNLRSCNYLESNIPFISEVEEENRISNGGGFVIEGIKGS